jgi:hypothetical protein
MALLSDAADALRRPVEEFVVQRNGQVRQAGSTTADTALIAEFRERAEQDLFTFAFGVLDMWWLYPPLHMDICRWLQRVPPARKMMIVPRGHCKSTIGCEAMPVHMWVQPEATNIYFPNFDGRDTRILLAGEKLGRAQDHLRVVQSYLTNTELLRAFWPHVVWENAKRQSRKWNDDELIIPRTREWPDPSIRAIGVGGAVTGAHPNCLIKDDITTEAAANSVVVMQGAVRWHENIRAVLAHSGGEPLEFIYGTRWAVSDLPAHVIEGDPTVEVNEEWRQVTEGSEPIYPRNSRGEYTEFGKPGGIEKLMQQHGTMFWLLYMNSATESSLVDFSAGDLREFELRGEEVWVHNDDRDIDLARAMRVPMAGAEPPDGGRGMRLNEYLDWEDSHARRSAPPRHDPTTGQLNRERFEYIKAVRRGGRDARHAALLPTDDGESKETMP